MRASVDKNELIAWGTPRARWVLLATVLGTGIAFLDMTVVNVALPTIGKELDATVAGLQWIVNGYTLTLTSLILIGGSLGDRFGRRRVFLVGIVWFAAASLFCGLAPTEATLVAARALQGIGGALLTPGSLAIIQASFTPGDRARAVGAWSGLSVVTTSFVPWTPPPRGSATCCAAAGLASARVVTPVTAAADASARIDVVGMVIPLLDR